MDINLIEAFVMVARQQSFSQAADHLFITQPAVSKRITALENELGVRLFDRANRRVTLTETGQAILPRFLDVLSEIESIRSYIDDLSGNISGSLTMGTSHHIGLRHLPPVLSHFKKQFPEVRLDMRFEDSEQAYMSIERGELEIALITLPATIPEQLLACTVWTDKLHIVSAPDHPLQQKHTKVTLTELAAYPCVLPSKDTYTYRILLHKLAPFNLTLDIQMSTNYIETLKMLVSSGFGWSLLPHTLLDTSIAVIHTDLELERKLGTVIHRKRALSSAAQAMLKTINSFADRPF